MGRRYDFKTYEEPIRTEYREPDSRDVENFYDGLTSSPRDKVAQLTDASVAFITMKKHAQTKCAKCGSAMMKEKCSNVDCGPGQMKAAGLISAAKGVGTKAMNMGGKALGAAKANPALAGAAVGAAGGAIAGGPDHRLGGAMAGAGLGAAAGHGAGKLMARAKPAAPATMHPTANLPTPASGSAPPGTARRFVDATAAAPPPPGARTTGLAEPGRAPTVASGPAPQPGAPGRGYLSGDKIAPDPNYAFQPNRAEIPHGPMESWPKSTPVSSPGLRNQSPEAVAQAQQQLAAGSVPGVGQVRGTGPVPGYVPPPVQQTQVLPALQKQANAFDVLRGIGSGAVRTVAKPIAHAADALDPMSRGKLPGYVSGEVGKTIGSAGALVGAGAVGHHLGKREKKAAWLPFAVAVDSSNAASSGESSALAKTAFPKIKIPSSTIMHIFEESVDIGRIKLQKELARHSMGKEKKASPYDDTPLMDMKQRAADKYPERVSAIESIRTDFKKALQFVADKVHDLRSERTNITQPKIAMQSILHYDAPFDAMELRMHREKIASEVGVSMKEMASAGGMPKQLMTPQGAGIAGLGALIGGGLGYLGSRGKPELGGKSKAEVELAAARDRQPEKPDGIGATIGKHVVNIHADVAEQMRKHPVIATLTGAGVGAGLALRVASLLGK